MEAIAGLIVAVVTVAYALFCAIILVVYIVAVVGGIAAFWIFFVAPALGGAVIAWGVRRYQRDNDGKPQMPKGTLG